MKLYTEEQLLKAIQLGRNYGGWVTTEPEILKQLIPIELPSDEELAILFHNKYEELAIKFGYETKVETRDFKKDSNNGKLMIAVCKEILEILNQDK